MAWKKVLGLTMMFMAAIGFFINFLIYNADFLANLTLLGWLIVIFLFSLFFGGIYVFFSGKK
jgi:hypothetical protein